MKKILDILGRKKEGIDCTEEESAELKMFLKEFIPIPGEGEVAIIDDIQDLFPLEYGEVLEEWEKLESQNPILISGAVMGSIFLIEKGWIDPMENQNADGYEPFGYKMTEQEAKDFCELHGYWTGDDCWSIKYKPSQRMWKYRYKEIQYCP